MNAYEIDDARSGDRAWIMGIWKACEAALGPNGVAEWWRYTARPISSDFWIVVRPHGFLYYRQRNDGWRSIFRLAVAPASRHRGVATALLDHIGHPVRVRIDPLVAGSAEFLRRSGFVYEQAVSGPNGRRDFHVYVRSVPRAQGVLR